MLQCLNSNTERFRENCTSVYSIQRRRAQLVHVLQQSSTPKHTTATTAPEMLKELRRAWSQRSAEALEYVFGDPPL